MLLNRLILALIFLLPITAQAADLTIDQLGAANALSGTESVPIFQGINPAAKTTTQGIANLAISATNLTTGTLPAGRLSGAYTGITQVGTLTAGTIGSGFTAIGNTALANSSMTIAGHSVLLGGTQTLSCSDLTSVGTGCAGITSQWTTGSSLIYYNGGNVGIGGAPVNLISAVNQTPLMQSIYDSGATTGIGNGGLVIVNTNQTAAAQSTLYFGEQGSNGSNYANVGLSAIYGTRSTTYSAGQLAFYTNTAGNGPKEQIRIDSSGNVGIGTAGPTQKLDVRVGDTDGWVALISNDSNAATGLLLGKRGGIPAIGTVGAGNMVLGPDGGNVGIGTLAPATEFQVLGPSATYFNSLNSGANALVAQISGGSAGTPITNGNASVVAITRREALTVDTEGGNNPALYVESAGTNTSGGGTIAQVLALNAYATQTGSGDVVGIWGQANQAGTGTYVAFGGFFNAISTNNSGGATAIATNIGNQTGAAHGYASLLFNGIDLQYASSWNGGSAVTIRSTGSGQWDAGIYIIGSVGTYLIFNSAFSVNAAGDEVARSNTAYSDRRMKQDIVPLSDGACAKVMALQPVNYTFISDKDKKQRAHIIAQDVLPIIPEAISLQPDGRYTADDGALLAYSLKCTQELYAQVQALKAR